MTAEVFEFDVTVRVRKRLHLSGPTDRETARTILRQALQGGMSPATFAKYDDTRHPVETIIDNDFTVDDPT